MLDKIDLKILAILQENAQLSNKDIAQQVGLSVTPTYERIKKMEADGIIKQYAAILNPTKTNNDLTVFCMVSLINQLQQTFMDFESRLADLKEIVSAHAVTGAYGYILKIVVKDIKAYNQFVVNKLSNIKEIAKYESMVALEAAKDTHKLPLEE